MEKQFHQLTLAIASSFVVLLLFLLDLGLFSNKKEQVASYPQPTIQFIQNN